MKRWIGRNTTYGEDGFKTIMEIKIEEECTHNGIIYNVWQYEVFDSGARGRDLLHGMSARSLGSAKKIAMQDDSLRSKDYIWTVEEF